MSEKPGREEREILRRTSRTFALSVQVLPRAMREPVEVAYLLARAADTVADTSAVPAGERIGLLSALRAALREEREDGLGALAGLPLDGRSAAAEAEGALLAGLRPLHRRLRRLPEPDRRAVEAVVDRLAGTMQGELEWFLAGPAGPPVRAWPDEGSLERYTDGIAGCVGPFWTGLVHRHVARFSSRRLHAAMAASRRYGRGLQLVNILRDLPEDLRRGICFLPQTALAAEGLAAEELLDPGAEARVAPLLRRLESRARRNLLAGLSYVTLLPRRSPAVRLASSLPAALGLATLSVLSRSNARLDPERRVKISRAEVRRLVLRSALWSPLCRRGPLRLV